MLGGQCRQLLLAEWFAFGIGAEAIQATGDVPQLKSYGRQLTRPGLKLSVCETAAEAAGIFLRHLKRMKQRAFNGRYL